MDLVKPTILAFLMFICFFGAPQATLGVELGGIPILADFPKQGLSKGLVIIAPAKKYTMEKPIFAKLASQLSGAGYTVLRFNWEFVRISSKPSKNFVLEASELEKIVSLAQKKFSFSKSKTTVIAKSFGSRVLMKTNLELAGHYSLLTPNCSATSLFPDVYSKIFARQRRINITISVHDPHCDVRQVYSSTSASDSKLTLYTTYGDHNFIVNKENETNQNIVVQQLVNWVQSGGE